jgi:hypothetical protein
VHRLGQTFSLIIIAFLISARRGHKGKAAETDGFSDPTDLSMSRVARHGAGTVRRTERPWSAITRAAHLGKFATPCVTEL